MAGRRHSKAPVPPTHGEAHAARSARRLSERLTVSVSPEQRLAATFDAFRSAARNSPARGPQAIAEAQRELDRLLRQVTQSDGAP